jgi:hypothetical protein
MRERVGRVRTLLGRGVAIVAIGLALMSCASISVSDGMESARQNKPEMVYVANFSTRGADFEVDRKGAELTEFKRNLQVMLRTAIAASLTDRLVPAFAEPSTPIPRDVHAWLVRGEFVRVKQGSRLLRSTIGFGLGGTKLETRVQVYDLTEDPNLPFLTFSTTGGSGAEPGAALALTTDPLQLAIGGVGGAAHGLSEDAARTAREVTAELSSYMYDRGWIPESALIAPKHEHTTETW